MKIEEGKFYRTRAGKKHGPMRPTGNPMYPWSDHSTHPHVPNWTAQGFLWVDHADMPDDLIAEWTDEVYSEGDTQPIASSAPETSAVSFQGVPVPKGVGILEFAKTFSDPVSHPPHYTGHPSGVECIQITEHMNFNRGNAVKYIWRAGEKGDEIQDLEKAVWYLQREIARIKK